mgnify:CR=1 FL=1
MALGLGLRARSGHDMDMEQWSMGKRGFGTLLVFLEIRAARRLGFRECARVREARVVNGERFDSVRFDLLRREWQP